MFRTAVVSFFAVATLLFAHAQDMADPCETSNGGCSHICNSDGSSVVCSCREGFGLNLDGKSCSNSFKGEVVSCASIHPCNYDNGGCEHMCNPAGSYGRCSCKEGFRLEADGKSCLDLSPGKSCVEARAAPSELSISMGEFVPLCKEDGSYNEKQCGGGFCWCVDKNGKEIKGTRVPPWGEPKCDGDPCDFANGGCSQMCNSDGNGMVCSCKEGFRLEADGKSCSEMTESCAKSNGGCSQLCATVSGKIKCLCVDGYRLLDDGKQCSRSDPCDFANGGCSQICKSDGISIVCSCKEGFRLDADGKSCSDLPPVKPCVEARDAASKFGGVFIPSCKEDGSYNEKQCHDGHCWCVDDQSGKEIPGTKKSVIWGEPKCGDLPPVKSCVEARAAVSELSISMGVFVRSCKEDGSYNEKQCYGPQCWCVDDQSGKEIPGTRKWKSTIEGEPKCGDPCSEPLVFGTCRGLFMRFYYNPKWKSCMGFNYGGCKGNRNNFNNKRECEKTCVGDVTPCVRARSDAAPAGFFGEFVPSCKEDGSYNEKQCHGGYCWCVDLNGKEVKGTRKGPGNGMVKCGGSPEIQ